mmetsp:Transcript_7298/g.18235  ORF Transcript_7298/g.18235 Transcript_7298/m.18235 type:complete len:239 (+) Transcript_7298:44-760(+)
MTQTRLEPQGEESIQKADGAKAADSSWLTPQIFQWILSKALPESVCTCGSRGGKQEPEPVRAVVTPREPETQAMGPAVPDEIVQLPAPQDVFQGETPLSERTQPIGTVEGYLERKGLRRWDLLWVSMFVQLDGDKRAVTIYDEDGDGERTLHTLSLLSEGLRIKQRSPLEWQLVPAEGATMDAELQFVWRAPDPATAETWLACLKATCSFTDASPGGFSTASTDDAASPSAAHAAATP